MTSPVLLAFPDAESLAARLAEASAVPLKPIRLHRFPDGESLVTLPPELPPQVALVRSLHHPNEKLVELLFALATCPELGAQRRVLVAPYLCYMRQDKAFAPGQAVSQRIVAELLDRHAEVLLTVDPHLHRVARLEALFGRLAAHALSAAPLIGAFLAADPPDWLLGPDEEAEQWTAAVAAACGVPYRVAAKVRRGDRAVEVRLPAAPWRQSRVVIVDDVVSSGHTVAEAARQLFARGAARVEVACTHALYGEATAELLADAGIARVVSTDSIPHPTNRISLAPLLAAALRECIR
ncbi:MAG: phosphoribosylpyrophosphate synthetase [Porticoccaceae bacterium]|nr:MAG: phosphoribosylpyrophosphate synthetase [Porticoccaceae bacterium]